MFFLLTLPTFLHCYCCCDFLLCAYLTHLDRLTRLCICFGDAESYKESLGCVHTKPVLCSSRVCPRVKSIKTGEINAVLNSGAVCLGKKKHNTNQLHVYVLWSCLQSPSSHRLCPLCRSCYVLYDRRSVCAVLTNTWTSSWWSSCLYQHCYQDFSIRSCGFLSGSPRQRRTCACRPSSAGRVHSTAPKEAGDGLPSLDTEVWSWGRGSEGQLGHGDQLARS